MAPAATAPYAAEIERLLDALKPQSLLALAPEPEALFVRYTTANPKLRYLALPIDTDSRALKTSAVGHFELGFVGPALAGLSKVRAMQLLAALRDLYTQRFVAVMRADAPAGALAATDFMALGLRHVGDYRAGDDTYTLYDFDIVDYKYTPDWLNSQHWAHPELFDKFRW